MALNYSRRPTFPAHVSEDNLVSPVRIVNGYLVEGVPDKNGEGYSRAWHAGRGEAEDWSFSYGRDRGEVTSPESNSKDIVDLLPSDPFGMDIETTFTAITGWLEDLEADYGGYFISDNATARPEEYGLFAGWNFIWNNALKFQQFPSNAAFSESLSVGLQSVQSNFQVYEKPHLGVPEFSSTSQFVEKVGVVMKGNEIRQDTGGAPAPYEFDFKPSRGTQDVVGFGEVSTSCSPELQLGEKAEGASNLIGVPHEAFAFALGYLGVKELLSVERVCRSLYSCVRGDPLLWMSIHIDKPLSERVTDDVLVQLANRALGNLRCLSLVNCAKVTDNGLRSVLETNPRLTKLSVPGCTRLSVEGIVNNMKKFISSKDTRGIKHVRVGGIYGVTRKHFDELNLLLGHDGRSRLESQKRPFYHRGNFYLPLDDDRALDIEMCPRCENFKLVYDCPAESCQVKEMAAEVCRGCTLCIPRCSHCGRCINNTEYVETFCLELLCSDCFQLAGQAG